MGMAIEDVEVGDPFFAEERPSHAAVKSDVRMPASGNENLNTKDSRTSTYHLARKFQSEIASNFDKGNPPSELNTPVPRKSRNWLKSVDPMKKYSMRTK